MPDNIYTNFGRKELTKTTELHTKSCCEQQRAHPTPEEKGYYTTTGGWMYSNNAISGILF
jgi:hypothetical protein